MRLSDLILLLQREKLKHGDLSVLCLTSAYGEAQESELTEDLVGIGILPSATQEPGMEKVITIGFVA